jgi:hypothetical protein
MSQFTEPYLPPSSMVYHPKNDIEDEDDLISFGREFEFHTTHNSSDILNQRHSSDYLEMNHVDQIQTQTPAFKADQTTLRLIATPRRKFQSADDRQKTAQTRKLTACVRCRMQRIRVRIYIQISGPSLIDIS